MNQFRIKVLQGLAEAMVQLNKFSFNQSGALLFDENGRVYGVGSRHLADFNIVYEKECNGTFRDEDDLPFSTMGPFDHATSYFLDALKKRAGQNEEDAFANGADILARKLIDWGLRNGSQNDSFVLAHPDLDTQNIFTKEDGTLTGIIDWDWVAAVPHAVGCQKFPDFLTADYNPNCYEFDVKTGKAIDDSGQCSPAELASYRAVFAQMVESLTNKATADLTRRSAVMGSLEIAANMPMNTLAMLGHLFEEIAQIPFDCKEGLSDATPDVIDKDEEDATNKMSLKEFLAELENLAPPEHEEKTWNALSTSQPEPESTSSVENTRYSPLATDPGLRGTCSTRKLGRSVRNWGRKKLQKATDCLRRSATDRYSDEQLHKSKTAKEEISNSRKAKVTQALHRWSHNKNKRDPVSLRCGGDQEKITSEDYKKDDTPDIVVKWLLKHLAKILELLRLRTSENHRTNCPYTGSQNQSSKNENNEISELSDATKKDACAVITRMLREDKGNLLSDNARKKFAHWMLQTIRREESAGSKFQEEFADLTSEQDQHGRVTEEASRISPLAKDSNPISISMDSGNFEASGSSNENIAVWDNADAASSTGDETHYVPKESSDLENNDEDHHEGSNNESGEKSSNRSTGDENDNFTEATTPSSLHEDASINEDNNHADVSDWGLDYGSRIKDSPQQQSEWAVPPLEEDVESTADKDHGNFTFKDICIALSKGGLDGQRMKRLKNGFLAVLNQTK